MNPALYAALDSFLKATHTDGGATFIIENAKDAALLSWPNKRLCQSAKYYPAALYERYGTANPNGWFNRLYLGDNLQAIGHLFKEFRGALDLIYLDPPFASAAKYKMKIQLRCSTKAENFEAEQYRDFWTDSEYLQFMFERLLLMRELLKETGSLFLHCDWHRVHHLRCILDEVFGAACFVNEIIWCYYGPGAPGMRQFNRKHDNILWYAKTAHGWKFNANSIRVPHSGKTSLNFKVGLKGSGFANGRRGLGNGKIPEDWWELASSGRYPKDGVKRAGYPTEKPIKLLERIIAAATDEGDVVADFFMGSGTTQLCAFKQGRRFIGVDTNPAAVQTTVKRLLLAEKQIKSHGNTQLSGFEVYNLNSYVYSEAGHSSDIFIKDNRLVIQQFRSEYIMRELSIQETHLNDWRQLVESVLIDWQYDGTVFRPDVIDVPGRNQLVKGCYIIPKNTGIIKIKITDLLMRSFEKELNPVTG